MFYQLPFLHGNFVTSDVTVYTKSTNAHRGWTRRSTARTGSKFEKQSGTTFINLQLRVSDIHVPVTLRCSKISEIFDSLDTAVVKRKINCWEGNTLTSHSWQQEKQFPIVNCSNHCGIPLSSRRSYDLVFLLITPKMWSKLMASEIQCRFNCTGTKQSLT